MKARIVQLCVVFGLLFANNAFAVELDVSGYASFKGVIGDNDQKVTYFNGLAPTNTVNFDSADNHIGIQFGAKVSQKIDMTVGLTAEGGKNSNYNINAEWAYASYNFNEDWSLRMGRYKGPFYMVSDYRDVGYAYPWVRPPLEVYSTNPIKSLSGVDLVMQKNVGDLFLLLELYAGSGTHTTTILPATAVAFGRPLGTQVEFTTNMAHGLNFSVGGDIGTFRIGYFKTEVDAPAFGMVRQGGEFGGVGFNIDWRNIVVYSEYIIRDTDDTTTMQFAFPDQRAGYFTLGYRIGSFLPYVTYAKIEDDEDKFGAAQIQESIALGLRTEVSDSAALKFEAMRVDPEKNPLDGTPEGYGLYEAGTVPDGMVYTVSFDVIF